VKRRVFGGAAMLVAVVMLAGCSKPSVKVDGSSTVYPITEAVAEEFRKQEPNVRMIIGFSGTGGGMKKFIAGEIDICDASRPITDSEKEACAKNGIEYIELEVAFDGLAVMVNPENDWCDCLTVDQLKAIWQPESAISKWSDVNADWPDTKINLYGPGTDSGTFDYFTEAIVGEARHSRSDYTPSEDDNVLVTGVAGDKNALGYFGLAYYEENRDRLKLVGIDAGDGNCVMPSQETVRDKSYQPLSRPLFVYVRTSSLTRPEVRSFVDYFLKTVGKLAPEVGYVTAPDEAAANDRQEFDRAVSSLPPAS
jgi:phosphate transport system substrate-binding protein